MIKSGYNDPSKYKCWKLYWATLSAPDHGNLPSTRKKNQKGKFPGVSPGGGLGAAGIDWCITVALFYWQILFFLLQELTDNIKQLSEEVKKLQGENQSLTQQLNDSLARLSDQSQDGLGEVLEEKFNLEKKVTLRLRHNFLSGSFKLFTFSFLI